MNRTPVGGVMGGVVLVGMLLHACSGGEHEPTARVQARAITGPPAISAPIALDTGTVNWNRQSARLLLATSDLDEHLLVYSANSIADYAILGVPIRGGEADDAFVLARFDFGFELYSLNVARTPTAWLTVYSDTAPSTSWSVVTTEAGERTEPVLLPLPCPSAGIAWGKELALVTDGCGNGLMLDGQGEPVGDSFVISDFNYYWCEVYCYDYDGEEYCYDRCFGNPEIESYGGNVAFDGMHFLTAYGYLDEARNEAHALLYSISADGTPRSEREVGVSTSNDEEAAYPLGLVSNGSSFLQWINVGRSSSTNRTNLVVVVSVDESDGGINLDARASVGPGVSCDGPSDESLYALGLANDYGFVRHDSTGEATGVKFSWLDGECNDYIGDFPVPLDVFELPVATSTTDEVLLASGLGWLRYDSSFAPLDTAPHISQVQAPLHIAPAVAHTGAGYFVGWLEQPGDPTYSLGRHVTELGALVEDEPLALRTAKSGSDKLLVASNGTRALSVLATRTAIQVDLVDDAGVVAPVGSSLEAGVTVAGTHSVTADADGFLLAWMANEGGYQAVKIDSEGSAGTPFTLDPTPVGASATAAAYDGANDVVVWSEYASSTTHTLYGVRVDATGTVLDIPPAPILTYPTGPLALSSSMGPALTRTSEGLVVIWNEHDGTNAVVRAQQLAEDLSVVGAAVDVAEFAQDNPASSAVATAWDGESLWFVWLVERAGRLATLWGRRLTASLEPNDEEPFSIDADAYAGSPVALTARPDGQLLVAYANPTAEGMELHIEGRLLSSTNFAGGTPCSGDSVCASGACVAGVCEPDDTDTGGSAGGATGGTGPSNGGSGRSSGGTTSQGGAASSGTNARSGGSAGEGAQGGSGATGGSSEATNTSIGGNGETSGGGGGCSCSTPGKASHANITSLVMLGAVVIGRRRPRRTSAPAGATR